MWTGLMTLALAACAQDRATPEPAPGQEDPCLQDASGEACAAASCTDGARNGDETDVDCGGSCEACGTAQACGADSDCEAQVCDAGQCAAPSCDDEVPNGDETDMDCGGSCEACDMGQRCVADADCVEEVCGESGVCIAASCQDGARNGDEADVDCGGSCDACATGQRCGVASDCVTLVCQSNLCVAPSCDDEVQNGDETDVDCGGSCEACGTGQRCVADADCVEEVCGESGVCISASCQDGARNGDETDVDCGGSCEACATGQRCGAGSDCATLVCEGEQCAEPSCDDEVQNGDETDVDCGGPCDPCEVGQGCGAASDCATLVCEEGQCAEPSCDDGVQNGDETDVDCGGPLGVCDRCAPGGACAESGDCVTALCAEAQCQIATSCLTLRQQGGEVPSGVYLVDPDGAGDNPPFSAYCDMVHDDGGWTLLMRLSGSDATLSYESALWESTDLLNGDALAPNSDAEMINAKFAAWHQISGHVLRLEWITPSDLLGVNLSFDQVNAQTALALFQGPEQAVLEHDDNSCRTDYLEELEVFDASRMRMGRGHQFYGLNGQDCENGECRHMRFGFASNDEPDNAWRPRIGMGADDATLRWESQDDCNGTDCGCYGNGYTVPVRDPIAANLWIR